MSNFMSYFISPVFLDNRTEIKFPVILMLFDQVLDVEVLHPSDVSMGVTLAENLDAGVHDVPEEGAHVPFLLSRVELVIEGGGALGELGLHLLGPRQGAARGLGAQTRTENHCQQGAGQEAHC